MKIKITSDSTCDLTPEQIAGNDITLLPLSVNMGGKEYRDGVDIVPADIFRHVEQGGDLPATAAVNIADYQEAFQKYLKEYDAVIHLNISAEFSSCHQNARLAAEELENVYVIDSRNLSTGHGLLVLKAAEMAQAGESAEVIAETLRNSVDKVDVSFILDQLDYMKKGGRCSSVAVLGANLLKLKPCIEVRDGKMGVCKKYRGNLSACMKAYLQDRLKDQTDIDPTRALITNAGIPQDMLEEARQIILSYQPFREVVVTNAGCTISSHCGPGTIGVIFMRK